MTGCLACSNSLNCLKCAVAFKYNGANLQCSNCLGSCLTCGPFYDTCITCDPAQNRYLSSTSCLCKVSYYDNSASGSYVCPLCSSVLANCYLCTNSSVCTQCQTNYYLYLSGAGKMECQMCNMYCESCTGTSTNCTTCNTVSYHRVLVGNSCVCDTNYISISNGIPCLPCSKMNDGCTSCTNETYCTSCSAGYYLKTYNATTKQCVPCPYYCPSCSLVGATVTCLSCPAGTYRTLTSGDCPCDIGYFDDNRTVTCEKCSDVLTNCLTCTNRTKCLSCSPGMYTDQAKTICAPCQSTCLTCGTYFDTCASCDVASNRVLSGNKCACQSFAY